IAARARTGARPRAFALSAVVAVIASLSTIFAPTPAAQAAAGIGLTKSASGSALLGKPISYTLSASNPAGGEQEYNLSFADRLPGGVTYVPHSTAPSDVGEPRRSTLTIHVDTHQVLVGANVSDLAVNASVTLSFSAPPDAAVYPVGSQVTNTASA